MKPEPKALEKDKARPGPVVDTDGPCRDTSVKEWLVANAVGGYASGTITGAITRRYHGLLVAALESPMGRTMMLNHLAEHVRLDGGGSVRLDEQARPDGHDAPVAEMVSFDLDLGMPVWRYDLGGGLSLEKRILMPHRQNTVVVRYVLEGGGGHGDPPAWLELSPWLNFRPHGGPLDRPLRGPYSVLSADGRFEIRSAEDFPPLRLRVEASKTDFFLDSETIGNVQYATEKSRGYDSHGELYTPGYFRVALRPGEPVALFGSTEPWTVAEALTAEEALTFERARRAELASHVPPSLRSGFARELVLAADQFVVTATSRVTNRARAYAQGDELRTVVAGYHWFTDWGRDTMISLEGLTLSTGRFAEARYILRTFAHYVNKGLIPNMFPEGNTEGVYTTADATLWFFHALDRYVAYSHDDATLELLMPLLCGIIDAHVHGTLYGIGVDPRDGLLRQGTPDYPLTWMDAKVGDYVVTPRRGKPVEINALFYNALVLLCGWVRRFDSEAAARPLAERAQGLRRTFNERFYWPEGGHLYDLVDGDAGDDASFRPNQIFAVSLPHAVLDSGRWRQIVSKVEARLLTPVGLRSLDPAHPDYKPRYFGDLRARDLAYHQGTVWAWLIGPFVDAWLKVHPDRRDEARGLLEGFREHVSEACVGSISEIFDADPPYAPRGCVAQAWSVAEVLRLLVKLG